MTPFEISMMETMDAEQKLSMTPTREEAVDVWREAWAERWREDGKPSDQAGVIARALATARLEERNKALDEANEKVAQLWSPGAANIIKIACGIILGLKHKDNVNE